MTQPTIDTADTFPWPRRSRADGLEQMGGGDGMLTAMRYPGLTPAERAAAMFIGDGCGGDADAVDSLAYHLEVSQAEVLSLLHGLLRKGFLNAVMGRWS